MGTMGIHLETLPTDDKARLRVRAVLVDDRHPNIRVAFDYLETETDFIVTGVSIAAGKEFELEAPVTPSLVRELPLAQWERSTHAFVQRWVRGPTSDEPQPSMDPERMRKQAEAIVRHLKPTLDPSVGKAAARTWESLVRYAQALEEYAFESAAGTPDPIGVIARRHGVADATVRTWLHRGREAGIQTARQETTLFRRNPVWREQMSLLRQADSWPSDDLHYQMVVDLVFMQAKRYMDIGRIMQIDRALAQMSDGDPKQMSLEVERQSLQAHADQLEEDLKRRAPALADLRIQIEVKERRVPPRIPRQVGALIGEDRETAFCQYPSRFLY